MKSPLGPGKGFGYFRNGVPNIWDVGSQKSRAPDLNRRARISAVLGFDETFVLEKFLCSPLPKPDSASPARVSVRLVELIKLKFFLVEIRLSGSSVLLASTAAPFTAKTSTGHDTTHLFILQTPLNIFRIFILNQKVHIRPIMNVIDLRRYLDGGYPVDEVPSTDKDLPSQYL